mmetsp:Transcript_51370/g.135464  ORF Transcript_51370/g.135464 Transcript_51370/m.135464 type:complete len:219 (+) Transcript_51370:172-828(+)
MLAIMRKPQDLPRPSRQCARRCPTSVLKRRRRGSTKFRRNFGRPMECLLNLRSPWLQITTALCGWIQCDCWKLRSSFRVLGTFPRVSQKARQKRCARISMRSLHTRQRVGKSNSPGAFAKRVWMWRRDHQQSPCCKDCRCHWFQPTILWVLSLGLVAVEESPWSTKCHIICRSPQSQRQATPATCSQSYSHRGLEAKGKTLGSMFPVFSCNTDRATAS